MDMTTKRYGLTLSTVNAVLADMFGYGSAVATGFIRRVEECNEKHNPTLSIDRNGTLRYNQEFFTKYVNTENKLKEAIFHELLHPVLGDMHRRFSYIANLASDMIINVLVTKTLGHGDLFQELYPDTLPGPSKLQPGEIDEVGGLLRPNVNVTGEAAKFQGIHNKLWDWYQDDSPSSVYDPELEGMRMQKHEFESIEEMRTIMDIMLAHKQARPVLLIGGHGHTLNDMGGQGEAMDSSLPVSGAGGSEGIDDDMKSILSDSMVEVMSKQAGYGDDLMDMAIRAIKANVSLVKELLKDFTAAAEFNSFKRYMKTTHSRRQVFPRKIARTDAVLLGAGIVPVFWKTERNVFNPKKDGISVFLDVSGSEWDTLPMTLGFLKAVDNFTDGVYQFSNKVVKTTLKELFGCDGVAKIDTTGGTDYNCIAEYCVQHELRKIVVITDGYAGMSPENQKKVLSQVTHACVIYTDNHTRDEFWRKNYHRDYSIHDLFKAC